jgi:hypothetical protein
MDDEFTHTHLDLLRRIHLHDRIHGEESRCDVLVDWCDWIDFSDLSDPRTMLLQLA